MASEHEKRIDSTIARVIMSKPFYGSILLSLDVREGKNLPFPTMGTDGRTLYYDASFVDSCSDEELLAVLVHEATHIAALHPIRREARIPLPWNIAADMEVNLNVEAEGLKLPPGCVPGKPGTAEEHYAKMKEDAKNCPCGCSGKGGKGKNDPGDGSGSGDPFSHSGWRCATMDAEAKPGESWEDVKSDVTETVRKAHVYAKMCGKVPAGLERMLEKLLTPKLKWDEVLRRFVESKYEPQVQWDSPSRRHLHRGIILPGMGRKRTVAEIIWGVDTSGSIGEAELLRACSEVRACLEECYPIETQLPLIWFDAAAHLDWIGKDDEMQPKGGGGTDFSVVMDCIKKNDLTENGKGLIIVTDGYCGSFGEPPGIPVLWLVFGAYASQFVPPWGEVVELEIT